MAENNLDPQTIEKLKSLGIIQDDTYQKALSTMPKDASVIPNPVPDASVQPQQPPVSTPAPAVPEVAMSKPVVVETQRQPSSVVPIGAQPSQPESAVQVPAVKPIGSLGIDTQAILPDLLKKQAEVFSGQEAAIKGLISAATQQAKGEVAALDQANKIRQEYIAKQQIDDQKKQAFIDDQLQKMNKFSADLANGPNIDPDRYMNSKTTGQKILMGIGMFLGGFDPNGNTAVKIVQNAINNDIEAQKADYQRKIQAGQFADNAFSRAMQVFGNERAARAATMDAMLAMTENQIKMQQAKYGGAEAAYKGKMALSMLEQQRVDNTQKWRQIINTELAQNVLEGGSAGGVMSDPVVRQSEAALRLLPKEEQQKYMERKVTGQGVYGFARTPKQAEEAQKLVNDTESAVGLIDELMKLGQDPSNRLSPEAKRRAQSLQVIASGKLREPILGPGTMQQQEYERLMSVLGNPTDLFNVTNMEALKTLKNSLQKGASINLKNVGVQKVYQSDADLGFQPGLK